MLNYTEISCVDIPRPLQICYEGEDEEVQIDVIVEVETRVPDRVHCRHNEKTYRFFIRRQCRSCNSRGDTGKSLSSVRHVQYHITKFSVILVAATSTFSLQTHLPLQVSIASPILLEESVSVERSTARTMRMLVWHSIVTTLTTTTAAVMMTVMMMTPQTGGRLLPASSRLTARNGARTSKA